MRLAPHLHLGPRRLLRRPAEALLVALAVAASSLTLMLSVPLLFNQLNAWRTFPDSSYLRQLKLSTEADWNAHSALAPEEVARTLGAPRRKFTLEEGERLASRLPPLRGWYLLAWQSLEALDGQILPAGHQTVKMVSSGWLPSLDGEMVAGRFFGDDELDDQGKNWLVIGEQLAKKCFPDGDAVGHTLVTDTHSAGRVTWTILGVSRIGTGNPEWLRRQLDNGLLVNRLVDERAFHQLYFVAERADQVPAANDNLRAAAAAVFPDNPPVVSNNYAELIRQYQATMPVMVFLIALSLFIQLIALWTLVSLYLARLPGMAWTHKVAQALGANHRQIAWLVASEILPVVLAGLGGGLAMALTLPRQVSLSIDPEQFAWGLGTALLIDAALVAGLVALPVRQALAGLSGRRELPVPAARAESRLLGWLGGLRGFLPQVSLAGSLAAMLFLSAGVATLLVAVSTTRQVAAQVAEAQDRLPLWIADGRLDEQASGSGDEAARFLVMSPRATFDRSAAELLRATLGPERVSRFDYVNAHLRIGGHAYYPREFFAADPSVAGLTGLELLEGRLPDAGLLAKGDQILLSDEIIELLGPAGRGLVGSSIEVENGDRRIAATVAGIYRRPAQFQLCFIPDALYFSERTSGDFPVGRNFSRFMVDPRSRSAADLRDGLVPRLLDLYPGRPGLPVAVWRGGMDSPNDWLFIRDLWANSSGMLVGCVVLALILLVVAGVNVLALTFNTVIRRGRELALQRALGRSFHSVVAGSFAYGFILALGAGLGALALAPAVGNGLLAMMSGFSGGYPSIFLPSRPVGLPFSPEVALVALPAVTVLVGLVSILPLAGLRKASIAGVLKEES